SGGVVSATLNGNTTTDADFLVSSVVINGSDGNDIITINSNGTNDVTINAGNGNDAINIAPTSKDLDNIGDPITINGDSGTDIATLSDESSAVSNSFQIVGAQVTRGASSETFNAGSGLETIAINAGAGTNVFSFTGL